MKDDKIKTILTQAIKNLGYKANQIHVFNDRSSNTILFPAKKCIFVGSEEVVTEVSERKNLTLATETRFYKDHFQVSAFDYEGKYLWLEFKMGDSTMCWGTRDSILDVKDTDVAKRIIEDVQHFAHYCFEYLDCNQNEHLGILKSTIRRAPNEHIQKLLIKIARHNTDKANKKKLDEAITLAKARIEKESSEYIQDLEKIIA